MATCTRCGKRGLFLKLYDSLCNDCLEAIHEEQKKQQKIASKPAPKTFSNLELAEAIMRSLLLSFDVDEKGPTRTPIASKELKSYIEKIHKECGSQRFIAAKASSLLPNPTTSREYSVKSWACEWAGAEYRKETIKWTLKWIETGCAHSDNDSSAYIGCTPQQSRLSTGYERLAKAYEGEYMFEEALAAYQKAWEIRPNASHYINLIARLYTKMNRLDDAISLLKNTPLIEGELKTARNAHLKELKEKKAKGYVYRPRKKKMEE